MIASTCTVEAGPREAKMCCMSGAHFRHHILVSYNRGIHHVSNETQYNLGSFFLLGALAVVNEVSSLKTNRP